MAYDILYLMSMSGTVGIFSNYYKGYTSICTNDANGVIYRQQVGTRGVLYKKK
jgi:hypothetical protein